MNKSTFSSSLRRELNSIKAGFKPGTHERADKSPLTILGQTLLMTISRNEPGLPLHYEFWQRQGTDEPTLDSNITVRGPVFMRGGQKTKGQKELLATITSGGKVKYLGPGGEAGRTTKLILSDAIDKFWRRLGYEPYRADGWDLSAYDKKGWGYVLKSSPTGSHFSKEIAIISTEMPGRRVELYTPKGDRKLTYEERQKIKVPTALIQHFSDRMKEAGFWNSLHDMYTLTAPSRVSAWEHDAGEKYFK